MLIEFSTIIMYKLYTGKGALARMVSEESKGLVANILLAKWRYKEIK